MKRRRIGSNELEGLGIDLNLLGKIDDGPGLRKCRNQIGNFSENCDFVAKNSKSVPESDDFENVLLWLENSICF